MLLCGVVRSVLSASVGAVVQIAIILLQNSNVPRAHAALPPGAEDEIILIEHLPGRRVHLQDFFWTGPEDAPPWVDPNQGLTFYETRTVHQTITIYPPDDGDGRPDTPDSFPEPREPECKSCIEPTPRLDDDDDDQSIGVLIGDDPGPRYWLLTVLRAGETVPPKIELKLARLYRAAFSRQQQRHLGLLSTDPRARRAAKQALPKEKTQERIPEYSTSLISGSPAEAQLHSVTVDSEIKVSLPGLASFAAESAESSEALAKNAIGAAYENDRAPFTERDSDVPTVRTIQMVEVPKYKRTLPLSSDIDGSESRDESREYETTAASLKLETSSESSAKLASRTGDFASESNGLFNETDGSTASTTSRSPSSVYHGSNVRSNGEPQNQKGATSVASSKLRSLDNSGQGVVQVRMQNTSVIEGGATRLIYSVHLGGKPVPAETAARDMALLSPQEVALELGAPVIIQSEPYLKETRPLALSRKRDAWLLIGAAGAAVVLLAFVVAGFIVIVKRKRAHSAVAAPPSRSILKKDREYATSTPGLDNAAFSSSETEAKTDGTSQRQTPRTLSRTPVTPATPDSRDAGDLHEISTDEEEVVKRKPKASSTWEIQERIPKKPRISHSRMMRTNAVDPPRTPDSMDSVDDRLETLESLEDEGRRQEEATASPHSYLSMPSCKHFPNMRSVEPLSRVLEPVMVRHLDIDSPEEVRRADIVREDYRGTDVEDRFLVRSASETKDPGVIGPIVWNLRRHRLSGEGNGTSGTDVDPAGMVPAGPVGRARRRLHELLEDSFSLFGSRDPKVKDPPPPTSRPTSAARPSDAFAVLSETRGRSAHVSPVATPTSDLRSRPRTSLPRRGLEEDIPETGHAGPTHPRGAWGSRPLSAGPFHRPSLPTVDTRRILTDVQLPPEDPAVPLIASIKKELEKFSPQ